MRIDPFLPRFIDAAFGDFGMSTLELEHQGRLGLSSLAMLPPLRSVAARD
jgi:hypothetical protein